MAPAPPNAVGIAQLSLGLLDFCVTIIADSLGVLEVGHRGLFGGAFGAENLATVSTMMFAIGDDISSPQVIAISETWNVSDEAAIIDQ